MTDFVQSSKKGFFARLASGDFGLAKTYWLFGVVGGVVLNIVVGLSIQATSSLSLLVVLMLGIMAYQATVLIGTWNAASRYTGNKLWAILGKVAVILGLLALASMLFSLFSAFG